MIKAWVKLPENASVIDYVLSSSSLIKYISSFAVKDFSELFYSHCLVEFSLKSVFDPILKPSLPKILKQNRGMRLRKKNLI